MTVMNKVPDGTSLDTLPVMISASSQQIWTRFRLAVGWHAGIASTTWTRFWMQFAGLSYFGRIATWLAMVPPPYKEPRGSLQLKGYIAPSGYPSSNLQLGAHVFIGDRVTIFQAKTAVQWS